MSRIDEILAMDRRRFLRAALGGGALLAVGGSFALPRLLAAGAAGGAPSLVRTEPGDVLLECFADDGRDLGACHVQRLVLSDAQWRARLSPPAFEVMRRDGTERAFSGAHERPAQPGIFRCAGCATALYDAATEFDSGTGWPSFWRPIAKRNVIQTRDNQFGMERIAINCAGCNSHLGHVFSDGPPPTGLRYCMNSVALRFVARTAS
ncbi:MAG: peptide-methionine (R)-S-oxide reductase [Rhodanobacter sp. 68-29]|nr:peptide-methionine (R)-S-oxide reductase MsrB [Rhodanobacter sp.]ODU74493.1 MAG: peptide-methionine (R)-S-oxide reductase [Rhodanobacter sp. SCN 69-32]OJY61044.1 MAG: peptide-methionine (R)-S-oxide reductase [Rhodanobacter sp. 68-29]